MKYLLSLSAALSIVLGLTVALSLQVSSLKPPTCFRGLYGCPPVLKPPPCFAGLVGCPPVPRPRPCGRFGCRM